MRKIKEERNNKNVDNLIHKQALVNKKNITTEAKSRSTVHVFLVVLFILICVISMMLMGLWINKNNGEINISNFFPKLIMAMIGNEEEEINNSEDDEITTIDITELNAGSDANHEHIYELKYDTNKHWEQCIKCDATRNQQNHVYQESWTMGDSCSSLNKLKHNCNCGYNYETGNTRAHKGSFMNYNNGYHIVSCTYCKEGIAPMEYHYDSGGRLGCAIGRTGTCLGCGAYIETRHENVMTTILVDEETYRFSPCFCGLQAFNTDLMTNNITYNGNRFSLTFERTYNIDLNGANVISAGASYYVSSQGQVTYSTYYINGNKITGYIEGYTYENIEEPVNIIHIISLTTSTGQTHTLGNYFLIKPEKVAPVVQNVEVLGNGEINSYSKKATVTVNAYENWCKTVYMSVYDSKGNCLQENVVATNLGSGSFRASLDLVGEYKTAENLTIKIKDSLGNEAIANAEVNYIDTIEPRLIEGKTSSKEWSKNKRITYIAEDQGIGEVQIAFNNESDFASAKQNEDIYTRTYNFTGDVYGDKIATLYLKDALGNIKTEKVTISNLDNTAPTITKHEIMNNEIVLTGNDINTTLNAEGSGIAKYKYLGSNETDVGAGLASARKRNHIKQDTLNRIRKSKICICSSNRQCRKYK